jgi:hypothetical protein
MIAFVTNPDNISTESEIESKDARPAIVGIRNEDG